MKLKLIIIGLLLSLAGLSQTTHYVKSTGSDSNTGADTTNAWASMQHAFDETRPGDTTYFLKGTYYSNIRSRIDPSLSVGYSGKSDSIITYAGYPAHVAAGDLPIFDCKYHCDSSSIQYNSCISLNYVEYIHFKNMTIRNVYQCAAVLNGAISSSYSRNLVFDHIIMHNIGQRGFYIVSGAWLTHYQDGDTEVVPYWDTKYDSTYFINCDVYNLCDSISSNPGNGADAWKTIHYRGNYISWEGCRAWNYSDDALDPSLVNGGFWRINNCWAMPGTDYISIGGDDNEQNGFKMSSNAYRDPIPSEHFGVLTNCLTLWGKQGFTTLELNKFRGNFLVYNNTAYKAGIGYYGTGNGTAANPRTTIYRNNIEWLSTEISAISGWYGVVLLFDTGIPLYPESNNTWDAKDGYPDAEITDTVTVTDADFLTVDSTTLVSLFLGTRQSDNSLPVNRPFQLAETSDLIDKGRQPLSTDSTDYTISYTGTAPDIGYSQYAAAAGDPPNVLTTSATYTWTRGGTATGNCNDDGGGTVSARGVCWKTSTNPTTSDSHTTNGSGTGEFTGTLTGLSANTLYYVRAYATNENGTAYGGNLTFTTPEYTILIDGSGKPYVDGSGNVMIVK